MTIGVTGGPRRCASRDGNAPASPCQRAAGGVTDNPRASRDTARMRQTWRSLAVQAAACAATASVGCGDDQAPFQYEWDDRRVLCSSTMDDLIDDPVPRDRVDARLAYARD